MICIGSTMAPGGKEGTGGKQHFISYLQKGYFQPNIFQKQQELNTDIQTTKPTNKQTNKLNKYISNPFALLITNFATSVFILPFIYYKLGIHIQVSNSQVLQEDKLKFHVLPNQFDYV